MDTVLHLNESLINKSTRVQKSSVEVATDLKSTLLVLTGVILGALAVGWAFLWFPVVALVSVVGLLFGAGVYLASGAWSWYDHCYPCEIDANGVEHPNSRIMTGIGRPSSGFMGGREADSIVPYPSSRFQIGGSPALSENVTTESEEQYRHGA